MRRMWLGREIVVTHKPLLDLYYSLYGRPPSWIFPCICGIFMICAWLLEAASRFYGGRYMILQRPVHDSTVAAPCVTHGSREVSIRPLSIYILSLAHVFNEVHKLWGLKYQFKTKKPPKTFLYLSYRISWRIFYTYIFWLWNSIIIFNFYIFTIFIFSKMFRLLF